MPTTTPNMSLTKPDPDGSSGTWDTELNASLDVIDSHDHTSGKGLRITTSALNINADLPFAGFAATGLKAIDFNAVTAITSGYLTSLFVSSADNELYWRSNGGVNVKITSGSTLNAALLGGITGASYGSGGAEVNYDGATKIYNFLQAANHRGKIDTADIRLFEPTSGITNAVKLKSPAALAASYDWIFPAALPASVTSLVSVSTAGQLGVTGAATMDGALTVTGLVTAQAGVTLSANQHVTISGTGRYKRAAARRHFHASRVQVTTGTIAWGTTNGLPRDQTGGGEVVMPLDVADGERITRVYGNVEVGSTGAVVTMTVVRVSSTGSVTVLATATSSGTGDQIIDSGALTETTSTANQTYMARFQLNGGVGTATNELNGVDLETDVP